MKQFSDNGIFRPLTYCDNDRVQLQNSRQAMTGKEECTLKYMLLVSHGDFSAGLKQTLSMFAGDAIDSVLTVGLKPDEAADTLETRFEATFASLPSDAEYVVLADIIGGSPLTTVCKVLANHGKLADTLVLGGVNFSMALTVLLSKDTMDNESLKAKALEEAGGAMKQFVVTTPTESDDDDI